MAAFASCAKPRIPTGASVNTAARVLAIEFFGFRFQPLTRHRDDAPVGNRDAAETPSAGPSRQADPLTDTGICLAIRCQPTTRQSGFTPGKRDDHSAASGATADGPCDQAADKQTPIPDSPYARSRTDAVASPVQTATPRSASTASSQCWRADRLSPIPFRSKTDVHVEETRQGSKEAFITDAEGKEDGQEAQETCG